MSKKFWITCLGLSVLAFATAFAACGDDDDGGSEEDKAAVADVAVKVAGTNGAEATQAEIDYYLAHITDTAAQVFGYESVAACGEAPEDCIGEPLPNQTVDEETIEIDGNKATLILNSDIGQFGLELIKSGDDWKLDSLYVPDDEIPGGTEVVDLELLEFAFEGDVDSEAVKSGDFAFHVKNIGQQPHEVILVPLGDFDTIEEAMDDESFEPEPVFVKFPYAPGSESDVRVELEPGGYGLLCFLPDIDDEEGTPHAFKGMMRDFVVE